MKGPGVRKRQRLTFLAVGAIGLAAAIGPGLAATLTVPTDATVPAAGQGTVTVQGFKVEAIDWTVDDVTSNVTQVRFTIERSAAGAAPVTAAADGSSGNAIVRVRLEADSVGGSPRDFVACTVTSGSASCDTSASEVTMTASDLATVNIIAFDRN